MSAFQFSANTRDHQNSWDGCWYHHWRQQVLPVLTDTKAPWTALQLPVSPVDIQADDALCAEIWAQRCSKVVGLEMDGTKATWMMFNAVMVVLLWFLFAILSNFTVGFGHAHFRTCRPSLSYCLMGTTSPSSYHVSVRHRTSVLDSSRSCLMTWLLPRTIVFYQPRNGVLS